MIVMLLIVVLALVIAGAVGIYVAFPYRGEQMPIAPEVAEVLTRGVQALPTMEAEAAETTEERHRIYSAR